MITINLPTRETKQREAKTLYISAKCSDCFAASLCDNEGKEIFGYDGYVPDFFPGQHYGDYVNLEIDLETGQILNWIRPSAEELERWVNGKDE